MFTWPDVVVVVGILAAMVTVVHMATAKGYVQVEIRMGPPVIASQTQGPCLECVEGGRADIPVTLLGSPSLPPVLYRARSEGEKRQ